MTEEAFLAAILAAPDDDAPRLIYADWLDEHGDADRADFIRLQCHLAHLPAGDPGRDGLEAAERRLLAAHGRAWGGPFRGLATEWEFCRGFIESVVIPSDVLGQAQAALKSAPLRSVKVLPRLTGPGDRALELEPLRYELEAASNDYDANWVVVRMAARDGPRHWSSTDPAYVTWELLGLAEWFRAIADGPAEVWKEFWGDEPNLSFRAEGRGDDARVTAEFAAEFTPLEGGTAIEFRPGRECLRRFADALSLAMQAFPVRPVDPDGPAARYLSSRPT
jgi:uncharacterized protein (TIGR02996 family)